MRLDQRVIAAALTRRDKALAAGHSDRWREPLPDHEVRGLELQVSKQSTAWIYSYKPHGTDPATGKRWPTRHNRIGTLATHSLAEARAEAIRLRSDVIQGGDPKAEAEAARAQEREAAAAAARATAALVTNADLLRSYPSVLAMRGRGETHRATEVRQARLALEGMNAGDLCPMDITGAMVETMLAAAPAGARRHRFGALDRFLRWAVRRTDRTAIAATQYFERHERPAPPAKRRRVWALAELAAIWRAALKLRVPVVRDLATFLLSVPCRRSEASVMRKGDLDLADRVWTQPTSKSGEMHHFPLNDRALEILRRRLADMPKDAGPESLVFAGPRDGKAYVAWSNLADAIERHLLEAKTPIADWRFHDVRRAFSSHLADRGIAEDVLDLALNHAASRSRGGVKGRYQLADRWADRVVALDAWDHLIGEALGEIIVAPNKVARIGEARAGRRAS